MKIGGTSYVEVGEGVVAEREVIRVIAAAHETVTPTREIVTLVAPVDTRCFDDAAQRVLTEIQALNESFATLTERYWSMQERMVETAKALEGIRIAITANWLFRLVAWLGRIF